MTNNNYDEIYIGNKVATVSDRLKLILEIRNMKQADLAHKTGINTPSISSYVTGKYEPRFSVLDKMAATLNVSTKWLAGYDVEMEIKEPLPDNKKNDALTDIIIKLRNNKILFEATSKLAELDTEALKDIMCLLDKKDLYKTASLIAELDEDKRSSVEQMLHAFTK